MRGELFAQILTAVIELLTGSGDGGGLIALLTQLLGGIFGGA